MCPLWKWALERLLAAWLSSLSVSPLLRVCLVQPSDKRTNSFTSWKMRSLKVILPVRWYWKKGIEFFYRIHADIFKIEIYLFSLKYIKSSSFNIKNSELRWMYGVTKYVDRYHTLYTILFISSFHPLGRSDRKRKWWETSSFHPQTYKKKSRCNRLLPYYMFVPVAIIRVQ